MYESKLTAVGHYVPDNIISNKTIGEIYEIDVDSIKTKTGILERRYFKNGNTSDLVVNAILNLSKKFDVDLNEVDCIILGTCTPDCFFPSTTSIVLKKLSLNRVIGFDISAACSGFAYALHIAKQMIASGSATKIIVCGGDKMSSTLIGDRNYKTAVLFGDGAGAVLLERAGNKELNVINKTTCSFDIDINEEVYLESGLNNSDHRIGNINMNGRKVYSSAVQYIVKHVEQYFKDNKLGIQDFNFFIPHQANKVMMVEVFEQIGVPKRKILFNIEKYGNSGAATLPISISDFNEQGKFSIGDRILLIAFGAGYTSSIIDFNWGIK